MIEGRRHTNRLESSVRDAARWALDVADHYRIPVTVTSGYRSWRKQAELRRRYEAGQSRFPANRPGDSSHNYGLSFDSVVAPRHQADWDYIRRYAGFEVLPNDIIHAQVPRWRSLLTPR